MRNRGNSQINDKSPRGIGRSHDKRGHLTFINGAPTIVFRTKTRRYGYPLLAKYNLQLVLTMALRFLLIERPDAPVTLALLSMLLSHSLARTLLKDSVREYRLYTSHSETILTSAYAQTRLIRAAGPRRRVGDRTVHPYFWVPQNGAARYLAADVDGALTRGWPRELETSAYFCMVRFGEYMCSGPRTCSHMWRAWVRSMAADAVIVPPASWRQEGHVGA